MTMQIAHVGLRNLRSYRTAELDLSSGTTLLSGDIGSGKTSLLYAMEMALFGFAEVDPGYLVRHGARDAEVSLTLTDGAHRWELRRRFVRKARKGRDAFEPTENSLATDGQRAAYSATELRRRTIELLGFPDNPNPRAHSDVWRWAVYLAQERMRDVLDPDADARMETVRKALGVEQYRLAGENARSLARVLQERATNLTEQATRHRGLEDEAVRWHQEEALARRRLSELEERERHVRHDLTQAREQLESLERERRELEGAREAVAQLERLAEELQRAIEQERAASRTAQTLLEQLEADQARESLAEGSAEAPPVSLDELQAARADAIRRLGELEGLRGQASVVTEQISERSERLQELATRNAVTRRELRDVQNALKPLETTEPLAEPISSGGANLEKIQAERAKLEEGRRGLDRRLAMATAGLAELAELVKEGVCPRCHRPVEATDFETHRRKEESVVETLARELEVAIERVRGADERARAQMEFERLHDQWQWHDTRRRDLRQRESSLRSQLAEEETLESQLATERTSLEERQRVLALQLKDQDQVRDVVSLADRAIAEAEERARTAAVRRERLAAIGRRIPEVRSEIAVRRKNEKERSDMREKVHGQIAAGRDRVRSPTDLEVRWSTARLRVQELDQSLQGLLREAGGPRAALAETKARLEEVARRQQERAALEQEVARLGHLAGWVDGEFRNSMIELERGRLHQGRLQFERRFAQYFAALMEDPSLAARVDENFVPWVDIAGQATPAEALSGGERTALALAYRLALGRMVRDAGRLTLETLILDEPTEGFSQEQTLRMGDLLEGLGLPQVILVSHERQLEGIADRVVRVRKKDGVSTIEEMDRPPETGTGPARREPAREAEVPIRRRKIRRLTDLESLGPETGPTQGR